MHAGLIAAVLVPLRRARQTTPLPDPDAELVARMRAGEEQAFLALVARHQASMLRLSRSMLPSTAVAEDPGQAFSKLEIRVEIREAKAAELKRVA